MSERNTYKLCAVAAIAGAFTLFGGTLWHPAKADPNDPMTAFAEYAANRPWVASHLMQLFGIILIVAALVLLAQRLAADGGASWAAVGVAGAVASLAVAAVLQAVDGIALKLMVDRWVAASAADKDMLFVAALAVRQIEIGLATIFSLLMGLTATLYGVALASDRSFPKWLGGLALLGGVPIAAAGIVIAYTGFSATAMTLNMSGSSLLLVWLILVGVGLWRLAPAARSDATTA
jgi:hypothetical protein